MFTYYCFGADDTLCKSYLHLTAPILELPLPQLPFLHPIISSHLLNLGLPPQSTTVLRQCALNYSLRGI